MGTPTKKGTAGKAGKTQTKKGETTTPQSKKTTKKAVAKENKAFKVKHVIEGREKMSGKDLKNERSKRRNALRSMMNRHFEALQKKDKETAAGVEKEFRNFVKKNYGVRIKDATVDGIYNAKEEKVKNDLGKLLTAAQASAPKKETAEA